MKFLLCPDKFKGSASSQDVIDALSSAITELLPSASTSHSPLSDGGEGFALVASQHRDGTWVECHSLDALHRNIQAKYYISNEVAYMDIAETNGLVQISRKDRNPMLSSTRGLGKMIRHATEVTKVKKIYIGLGGSATNDGGAGMAYELGATFLDSQGNSLEPIPAELIHTDSINLTKLITTPPIIAACDVNNPLLGENGASAIYGPQKGVIDIDYADSILHHLMLLSHGEKSALTPGAGAAGGTAYGLLHYLNAQLISGFEIIAEISHLEEKVIHSDVVITGEGSLDAQTLNGKGPYGLATLCKKYDKPIYAIAGNITSEVKEQALFNACYSLSDLGLPMEECLSNATELIRLQMKKLIEEKINPLSTQ